MSTFTGKGWQVAAVVLLLMLVIGTSLAAADLIYAPYQRYRLPQHGQPLDLPVDAGAQPDSSSPQH